MAARRPLDPTRMKKGIEAMTSRLIRLTALAALFVVCTGVSVRAETRTIARCGVGFLEEVDGYRFFLMKKTAYEMGYQQGALLRDDIRESVHYLFEVKGKELKVELGG